MPWHIDHIIQTSEEEDTIDPIRVCATLPEALEYMAANGVTNWTVGQPALEFMSLETRHNGKTYEISHREA